MRIFGVVEMFYTLTVVVVISLEVFVRIHKILHPKKANFILCNDISISLTFKNGHQVRKRF